MERPGSFGVLQGGSKSHSDGLDSTHGYTFHNQKNGKNYLLIKTDYLIWIFYYYIYIV